LARFCSISFSTIVAQPIPLCPCTYEQQHQYVDALLVLDFTGHLITSLFISRHYIPLEHFIIDITYSCGGNINS